jgi:Spy/CpxP family protein refolding chaperone
MTIGRASQRALVVGIMMGLCVCATAARADEEKSLRPELEQLMQSVGEKLEAVADKLELSADQQTKIRETRAARSDNFKALRAERKNLLQDELKALGAILTPEQKEKIREYAEDRMEQVEQTGTPGLPRFVAAKSTLAERAESAAEKLGLTDEQRKQIITALSDHADRHLALKATCRQACEHEFKAIAEVLTPEQRLKARAYIEVRTLQAAAVKTVADHLYAITRELALSGDQLQQVAKVHSQFLPKYRELRSDRRAMLKEEMKAIAGKLTPEQREQVKDFCEDRIIIGEVATSGQTPIEAAKALRETVAERLEAVGDKLKLSADQRTEIRGVGAAWADKFKEQREQRKALRREELQAIGAILTPEQREKAKDLVEDRTEL